MLSSEKAFQWSDFDIIETLGEGQAGVVSLAKLKRPIAEFPKGYFVAIKQYKTWMLEKAGQFERIICELEVGRRVRHPNLVRTISVIRDANGNPALVMDYYPGQTLEKYFQDKRNENAPVDVEFAMQTISALASALQALHNEGVIHRDVKPGNIILSKTGPVLMDLGVVKSKDFPEQTTRNTFLGTIRYAAPEYLFGEEYDSSIDVYGLGVIIYEFFLGKIFPSEESNWAKLVGNIRFIYDAGIILIDRKRLCERVEKNLGEFIEILIFSTVVRKEHRTLFLEDIISLIDSRIWEKPFYQVKEGLMEGYPDVRLVGRIGEWEDYPMVPFEKGINDLMEILTEEDKKVLHDLCEEVHFEYRTKFHVTTNINRLNTSGLVRYDEESKEYHLHPTLMVAYRYGYL